MREKALATMKGDTYQLIEVKFGSYPYDMVKGERTLQGRLAHRLDGRARSAPGRSRASRTDGTPGGGALG